MVKGATLRYIAYDILETFKQTHSEAEIGLTQMVYWIMVHADRLKKLHMDKIDSGAFITDFVIIPLVDSDTGRNYFELPTNIYDYDQDKGIDYLTYEPRIDDDDPTFTSVQFTRTTIKASRRLYYREEEKPSPSNPYFYRINGRIYLLGVERIDVPPLELGLLTTFDPTSVDIDLDEVFEFPQDLIPVLKREIMGMGVFVLQLPKDTKLDGVEESGIGKAPAGTPDRREVVQTRVNN